MEKSKQFQEILNLGKTLVELFSEHGRTDLTISWMAHYLAEVMQTAEEEKNVAKKRLLQKECSDIILALWEKRNRFPDSIRPLSNLTHTVSVIDSLKDEQSNDFYWRRFRETERDSVWGTYIYTLRNAVEDSLKITLSATVTNQVLEREKQWGKHSAFLQDEEKEIIEFLDKELDKDDSLIRYINADDADSKKDKATPDRMTRVFIKLREILDKQTKALDKLEAKILKPKPKPTARK